MEPDQIINQHSVDCPQSEHADGCNLLRLFVLNAGLVNLSARSEVYQHVFMLCCESMTRVGTL